MLTEIEPCEPPELYREPLTGPTRPIDCAILAFLEQQGHPVQLAAITAAVGGATHYVHFRVCALMDRGLIIRSPVRGGPRRGPGASVYSISREASWTCPS